MYLNVARIVEVTEVVAAVAFFSSRCSERGRSVHRVFYGEGKPGHRLLSVDA